MNRVRARWEICSFAHHTKNVLTSQKQYKIKVQFSLRPNPVKFTEFKITKNIPNLIAKVWRAINLELPDK